MRKTLIKNSPSKKRPAGTGKSKSSEPGKKNTPSYNAARYKPSGNLLQILNYQYQDSDLEQFVF